MSVDNETGTVIFDYDKPVEEIEKSLHRMGYSRKGEGNAINKATSYVSCMIGRVKSEVEEISNT